MILTSGSLDAVSFTDDTSLPEADAKVSIHAQVMREPPPEWFYTLLRCAPRALDHAGELKSKIIVEVFFDLPEYERRKVLVTLRTARIHITDPRLYTHNVDEALSDMVPGGDVNGFIERLDKAQQRAAETERRRLIARRMLWDAPSQQIMLKHLAWEYQSGLRIRMTRREPFIDKTLMPYFEEEPPEGVRLCAVRARQEKSRQCSLQLSFKERVGVLRGHGQHGRNHRARRAVPDAGCVPAFQHSVCFTCLR